MPQEMKQLKSTSQNLRELFERNISVHHIAEALASFDAESPTATVLAFMKKHEYDVVGVRRNGLVVGYAKQTSLEDDTISNQFNLFSPTDVVDDITPLLEGFSLLRQSPQVFVRAFGQVGGIVTRGDLQKAPVRMWLFGLIALVEMQLLRLIRSTYPADSWRSLLTKKRLKGAENILADRQQRNTAIDLADCLQLCDKRDIVFGNEALREAVGFLDADQGKAFLIELERIRNNLAHAQDIVTGYWPDIVDLAEGAERLLRRCEEAVVTPVVPDSQS